MDDSKIRVLHVTFNMNIGGTEQVIRQIIENSDAEKFEHEILCIDGEVGPLGLALKKKGIHIESTRRQAGTDFKLIRFIRCLVESRGIEVLHCHQYTPYFYGVLAATGKRTKVIFTEHGRFFPDRHHFKRRFINPLLVMMTDHITAISKSTADAVAKYEYMRRDRIDVIYNGICDLQGKALDRSALLNELNLTEQYRYIGTISRLEPIKNQAMMIKAFHRSKQEVPELKLVLIGDGAIRPELMALARSLNVEQDVIFTGFIDNPQRFLSLFEVFLLSSFSEGTSMTLLEAMSLSRPSVVTRVGGSPEIVINHETGILVPSDDVMLFSEAITTLLSDAKLRTSYGKAGRQRFLKEFAAEHMIKCYHALYKGK
ncbi:MAG: glycosyltransferase [Thiotrichaceae bacterium]|nr:MAG: glycosyltransferase [Thiotrichaceae bacterium]